MCSVHRLSEGPKLCTKGNADQNCNSWGGGPGGGGLSFGTPTFGQEKANTKRGMYRDRPLSRFLGDPPGVGRPGSAEKVLENREPCRENEATGTTEASGFLE